MLDLLITNGRIVDGTGSPWYLGTVGIKDGKICGVFRSEDKQPAKQVIDAKGKVIAPGFIDMHSHADLAVLRDPGSLGRLRQGVTTQVIGNCGLSVAPMTPKAAVLLSEGYEAILGSYPTWQWNELAEYMERVSMRPLGTNIAVLMGHATLRTVAMNGVFNREPSPEELKRMCSLISAAMDQGAFGITTGLIYPPSCFGKTAELITLSETVMKYGGMYASHIRGEGRTLIPAIREVIEISDKTGIPGHISHLKANNPTCWGKVVEVLELIEEARNRGLDISCDQYPYTSGSASLGTLVPPWAQEGGIAAMVDRLRDPGLRNRIKTEFEAGDTPGWDNYVKSTGWESIVISWVKSNERKNLESLSVAKIAELQGQDPWDAVFDLIIAEQGAVQIIAFIMSEDDVQTVLRYRGTMIGSDGIESGDKPHPRLFGTFPRIYERYVRELKVLTLEDAVRKMTSLPAGRLGLSDRGVIKSGLRADLVIFDPEHIAERATFTEPHLVPEGIEYVIVNGGLSITDNQPTGKYYGRVLRRNDVCI